MTISVTQPRTPRGRSMVHENAKPVANFQITGLEPSSTHGFHVHEFGDISGEGCLATGGHYNPFNQTHGAPEDKVRHAGDLGNVVANENGTVILDITDRQLRLRGARSIVGRGVVLHSGVDDLGRGNNTDSKKTGNAGSRLACGAIGIGNATALAALN